MSDIINNKGEKFIELDTGIDIDGNTVKALHKEAEWISATKLKLPNGKVVAMDPFEVAFEVYNHNKFTVVFQNCHYDPNDYKFNPMTIVVPPDTFKLIPHRYYTPWIEFVGNTSANGEKFTLIENMGDKKFIGNKAISRPEAQKSKLF